MEWNDGDQGKQEVNTGEQTEAERFVAKNNFHSLDGAQLVATCLLNGKRRPGARVGRHSLIG